MFKIENGEMGKCIVD